MEVGSFGPAVDSGRPFTTRATRTATFDSIGQRTAGLPSDAAATVRSMGQPTIALYDQQCEICQAMVSWIQLLDPSGEIACVPIDPDRLTEHHPDLDLEECLRRLHVIANGEVSDGWEAVVAIARRLPRARPLVWIDRFGPTRRLARSVYDWLAANRYELSKCRGGACSIDKPATTKRPAPLQVFWTCYNLGLVFRLPLIASHVLRTQADHVVNHARTYRKAVDLLDGNSDSCSSAACQPTPCRWRSVNGSPQSSTGASSSTPVR